MGRFTGYVLASDFDSTLIGANSTISQINKDALHYFVAEGGLFVGATGRTEITVQPYLTGLPFNAPWVLYNGAVVYDFRSQEFLMRRHLDREQCLSFVSNVVHNFPQVNAQIYTGGPFFEVNPFNPPNEDILREKQPYTVSPLVCVLEPWIKVVFSCADTDKLRTIERQYDHDPLSAQTAKTSSASRYFEITPIGADKGAALTHLLTLLPSPIHTVAAIGDYFNDITMLQTANISACPENALIEVSRHADMIVKSCNHHAVADFIQHLEQNA